MEKNNYQDIPTDSDDEDVLFQDALDELVSASESAYQKKQPEQVSGKHKEKDGIPDTSGKHDVKDKIEQEIDKIKQDIEKDILSLNSTEAGSSKPNEKCDNELGSMQGSEKKEHMKDAKLDDGHLPDEEEDEEEEVMENIIIDEENLKEIEAQFTEEEINERKDKAQKLKTEGNTDFREERFDSAIALYTEALQVCPLKFPKERSIMYSNIAACKLHLDKNESAITDCTKALELNPNYMRALLRRAELYEKVEKLDEALTDYQKALEMDPGLQNARQACMRLPDQIKERNEKLKAEMLEKLKDLGNLVLKPFGLSTNNFKLQQDPNTGGYSVQFQQSGSEKKQPPPL